MKELPRFKDIVPDQYNNLMGLSVATINKSDNYIIDGMRMSIKGAWIRYIEYYIKFSIENFHVDYGFYTTSKAAEEIWRKFEDELILKEILI
jgi:hypothetical protein